MLLASSGLAMGGPSPEIKEEVKEEVKVVAGDKYLIDNFESGSLKSPRDWWTFDIQDAGIASNDELILGGEEVARNVGKYSIGLRGKAKNWYGGGVGTYIAKENQDLSKYNSFSVDIYGNGSGTAKIELYDDDNGNWQVEQNRAQNYKPLYDDKLVYDIVIDWKGWKNVSILLDDFVDDNPGVGDDVWNPEQNGESGGLLQLQIISLADEEAGKIDYNLDNIYLTVDEE